MNGAANPRLMLAAGLYGSASTWMFNVMRAVAQRNLGRGNFHSLYSDAVTEAIFEPGLPAIVKCHAPSQAFAHFLRWGRCAVALSVRDPRDAAASLIRRFGMDATRAIDSVARSASALISVAGDEHLILRYEDGFVDQPATVASLAKLIGMPVSEREAQLIWRALTPAAVRRFVARAAARGAFGDNAAPDVWDAETHWHPNHVGDRQVGKYPQVLTPREASRLMFLCRPFHQRFGYAEVTRPVHPGARVLFSSDNEPYCYLTSGFSEPEPWGVWSSDTKAEVTLPLSRGAIVRGIDIAWRLSPVFAGEAARLTVSINGTPAAEIVGLEAPSCALQLDFPPVEGELTIGLTFNGLHRASALGYPDDERLLGAGLETVVLRS